MNAFRMLVTNKVSVTAYLLRKRQQLCLRVTSVSVIWCINAILYVLVSWANAVVLCSGLHVTEGWGMSEAGNGGTGFVDPAKFIMKTVELHCCRLGRIAGCAAVSRPTRGNVQPTPVSFSEMRSRGDCNLWSQSRTQLKAS